MKREEEFRRLESAVDAFAAKMKGRLRTKCREGKSGWEKEISMTSLMNKMLKDVDRLDSLYCQSNTKKVLSIDVANRAMMVWLRVGGKFEKRKDI